MRNRKNAAPTLSRRRALALLGGMLVTPQTLAQVSKPQSPATAFAPVVPGYSLRFPHDEGSHPEFRTEWWYVTGWLDSGSGSLGFQITFFRFRPELKRPGTSWPRMLQSAIPRMAGCSAMSGWHAKVSRLPAPGKTGLTYG
jgi:hypothetical protein